ncbi:mitochondrial transcription termination [Seminavis robusta]|uniref:Mitochondrial transcription termination n=1 Tax=Seminavis robusta TaxID=568900 RepID=A0A9N8E4M5_9STRA|nr:mitochondrial transcription termination [Seminavis robusta]|eukprot:Sro496_g154640.1 mitochondrial transcription termination (343) ;mRNA; r:53212-54240
MKKPTMLSFKVSTLKYKMNWFQETFGWSRKQLLKVLSRTPDLLNLSIHDNIEPTVDSVQQAFNLTNLEVSKVLMTNPQLMTLQRDTLTQKAEWLQRRLDLKSTEELSKIVRRAPNIMNFSIDNIESKIKWLEDILGLAGDATTIAAPLKKAPSILHLKLDTMASKVNWLQSSLNITDSEVAKIVWKDPAILAKNIEENLEPTLHWLVNRLGCETAKQVISRLPSTLSLSIPDSIEPKMEYLQTKFQLDEENLLKMIKTMPTLLGMSFNNINNTLQFYSDCYGEDQALQFVIGNPGLLTLSLKNRLIPRWEQAVELEFEKEVPISVLAMHTPKKWENYVESKR